MSKIHIYIILFFSFNIFSQVEVNSDLVSERWSDDYLKSTLDDSRKLQVIKQSDNLNNDLEKWEFYNKQNLPCVYITIFNEYLYNFHAIRRSQVVPEGYRIPTIDDFKKMNFLFNDEFFDSNIKSNSRRIRLTQSSFIEGNNLYIKERNSLYIWTFDEINSITKDGVDADEYAYAYSFNSLNRTSYESNSFKISGFPILLIENQDYKIKNSVFDYSILLPEETFDLYKSLANQFRENKNLKPGSYSFTKQLSFNGIGKNTSFENAIKSNYQDSSLLVKIDEVFNDWSDYPSFKGQPLNSILKIKIDYLNYPSNQKIIRNYHDIKTTELQNKTIFSNLDKYKIVLERYDLAVNFNNGKHTINWSEFRVVDLKTKSYFNAFKSIYGGGYQSVSKHYNSTNRYKNKTMRGIVRVITPTFGSLAIISYFSRKHYYDNYLASIDKATPFQSDFKVANTFQKVFLGSLLIYASTSIFDFCWTINEVKINKRNKKFVMSNIERFYSSN